jgi:RIO-like serine/threonine protein kinase
MVKFDASLLRYLSKDDFRVLTAIEMGMRNHELVPVELIESIARLKHGGTQLCISTLLRAKLIKVHRAFTMNPALPNYSFFSTRGKCMMDMP